VDELKTELIFNNMLTYTYFEMIINILLAMILGFIITGIYRQTHKGLSYSQSFSLTILFVTVIVAIVMMVIGNSLARAFALVGALSIIRFRTVVKDTKDTAYVFAGLALGMASGTSNYFLAISSTCLLSILALATHHFNYAALYKSEFILKFMIDHSSDNNSYQTIIDTYIKRANLIQIEPFDEGKLVKMTFDIKLKEGITPEVLTTELDKSDNISEVILIGSSTDVDY